MLVGAVVACLLPQTLLATLTTSFAGGVLTVVSDADDAIAITCDGVNVKVNGGDPTPVTACTAITGIVVTGGSLDNNIDLTGVVTATFTSLLTVTVSGAGGNEEITGSEFADTLNGDDGNDTITGHRGADTMNGGADNDTMIWNPGDGSDVADGGTGNDTMVVNGGNVSETFTISATATGAHFDRVNPNPFSVDIISTTENLLLNANGGADVVTGTAGLSGVLTMTLNGGNDNDVIKGGDGPDILNGDAGDDTLTGFPGADTMNGGADDDTMIWNPGDGSDVADGGTGDDTMVVNGGNVSETFTISATATGALFDRVNPNPFSVDIISTTENLLLNANGGADVVTGTAGLSGVLTMTLNGGNDNDLIKGGNGPDILNGDAGDDTLIGFQGADTMNGGLDNDTMIWNPGDGSDVANGDTENDTMVVNGGNVSETFTISATTFGHALIVLVLPVLALSLWTSSQRLRT